MEAENYELRRRNTELEHWFWSYTRDLATPQHGPTLVNGLDLNAEDSAAKGRGGMGVLKVT